MSKKIKDIKKSKNSKPMLNENKRKIFNKTTFIVLFFIILTAIPLVNNLNLGINPFYVLAGIGAVTGAVYGYFIAKNQK